MWILCVSWWDVILKMALIVAFINAKDNATVNHFASCCKSSPLWQNPQSLVLKVVTCWLAQAVQMLHMIPSCEALLQSFELLEAWQRWLKIIKLLYASVMSSQGGTELWSHFCTVNGGCVSFPFWHQYGEGMVDTKHLSLRLFASHSEILSGRASQFVGPHHGLGHCSVGVAVSEF